MYISLCEIGGESSPVNYDGRPMYFFLSIIIMFLFVCNDINDVKSLRV